MIASPSYAAGTPLLIPEGAPSTLVEALISTAAAHPGKGVTYVRPDRSTSFQSYPALLERARRILGGLTREGLRPGDRVELQIDVLEDHFSTFWACVLGGITPVTVAVAASFEVQSGVTGKLFNTWALLERPVILASSHLVAPIGSLTRLYPMEGLRVLAVETVEAGGAKSDETSPHEVRPEDLAFFQLSSGSTGVPKVIQETHRGILRHAYGAAQFNGYTADDVSVNWLPVDHVVPILTCHLKDVWLGASQVMISAAAVLADPLLWLDLLEQHKATHTWSPNFGFKLVAERLAAGGRARDLSSMKFFMNAGEQVTLPVVDDFLRGVAPFGVRQETMQPAFGMAEVCTCMTYANDFNVETGVHRVAKASLGGPLTIVDGGDPGDASTIPFVDLGPPVPGVEIRITNAENRVLPERTIGRLQIRGGVVTPGYFNNPTANQEAFVGDGWFNSGDLGFMHRGRLTLTGREKEIIIIRGANFYCYEIEDLVNQIPGVEPTFVAATAVDDPAAGTEGLAIFFVAREPSGELPMVALIRAQVAASLGISPTHVIPLPKASFPKTTSGKIQRTQLKKDLVAGRFAEVQRAVDRHRAELAALDWIEPATDLERDLAAIFARVLGLPRVGARQNFFELGGHSIVAVQLFSEIEQKLGRNLPIATLLHAPTIAQLAVILSSDDDAPSWSSLVPIRPEGRGQPFFCVHAIGANVLNYRLLSRHLGDVRFYGLQSYGLDGKHAPHERVEDMATHYLAEIRTVQPRGPYLLGGGSSGGVVAWEMAQQLRAAGEEVALLALIDTYCNYDDRQARGERAPSPLMRLAEKLDRKMGQFLLDENGRPGRWLLDEARGWLKRSVSGSVETPNDSLSPLISAVKDANVRATRAYMPGPYRGRAVLFLTLEEPVRSRDDTRLGWTELAQGGLELHTVPGNHDTVLDEPYVAVLAARLLGCLDRERADR